MLLAQDGIFPILRDSKGNLLKEPPASGFKIAGTIQGEGKLNGTPSLFIRLAGCNLHCQWHMKDGKISSCDTMYAAYQVTNARQTDINEIVGTILNNAGAINHIVITGGEPFLQSDELKVLCHKLKEKGDFHLTIETNATIFDQEVAECIDFFSLSPKLSSSGNKVPPSIEIIQQFINHAYISHKDFQLKFVYSGERDIQEIELLLKHLKGWKNEDILLMPLGGNPEMMRTNINSTLEWCLRKGWRYCDRLHLSLFGDKVGV